MTGTATSAESTTVGIILCVTGKTVTGRTYEHIIDMATRARYAGMLAGQLETGQVMIKSGWQPPAGSVTGATIVT
jgi:hypothetical protein